MTGQDKARQLNYIFAHDTVMTELALQVAEANQGAPGTIKCEKASYTKKPTNKNILEM